MLLRAVASEAEDYHNTWRVRPEMEEIPVQKQCLPWNTPGFWCFFERFSVSSGGKSLMFTVVGKPCAWLVESS